MRILIILLLVFTAYSKEFINTQLILNVEKKYNRFAKNRFNALNRLLKRLEKKDELTKLQEVNDFFNSVGYGEDIDIYKVNDYWATPFEFLAKDKGDCEDYVIAKYLVLKYLGVSSEKMFLTYVRVKDLDRAHMVLSYYKTSTSEPLILDSIRRIIFPASKRKDLKPIYNFNPNILKNGKKTSAHKKWDNLIKNFRENKI